ncbi:hypothetical protein A7K99_18900 [Tatumella citrea]|uniref:Uncharacterized protein n=1 Tax=Tatumella citrea TaxID=53336 RepID=A0A1Y0LD67_TATCI|nr:hypothetical protein A7K98_18915 [Tatumella citrea]ARU99652.1 hypothetical protein A7K99_18900 [Tatumella citrea]
MQVPSPRRFFLKLSDGLSNQIISFQEGSLFTNPTCSRNFTGSLTVTVMPKLTVICYQLANYRNIVNKISSLFVQISLLFRYFLKKTVTQGIFRNRLKK